MKGWLKRGERVTAATARRVTGISTPFGGINWADSGPSESELVRRFIIFLEDRRVLYSAAELEVVSQVEGSVHAIRRECTTTLQALSPGTVAAQATRAIREACRRFHDDQQEQFRFFDDHSQFLKASAGFFAALGALRATIGYQVALLAAHYDIDVEGDLSAVLPKPEVAP